jgi:hypothetical protein
MNTLIEHRINSDSSNLKRFLQALKSKDPNAMSTLESMSPEQQAHIKQLIGSYDGQEESNYNPETETPDNKYSAGGWLKTIGGIGMVAAGVGSEVFSLGLGTPASIGLITSGIGMTSSGISENQQEKAATDQQNTLNQQTLMSNKQSDYMTDQKRPNMGTNMMPYSKGGKIKKYADGGNTGDPPPTKVDSPIMDAPPKPVVNRGYPAGFINKEDWLLDKEYKAKKYHDVNTHFKVDFKPDWFTTGVGALAGAGMAAGNENSNTSKTLKGAAIGAVSGELFDLAIHGAEHLLGLGKKGNGALYGPIGIGTGDTKGSYDWNGETGLRIGRYAEGGNIDTELDNNNKEYFSKRVKAIGMKKALAEYNSFFKD